MHELFERGLVGSVMGQRCGRMVLVEGAIFENLLVHRAGRNENKPPDVGGAGRFDKLECS